MTDLKNYKSVHFIGIGGIGISAIARMLLLRGVKVSGSDQAEGEVSKALRNAGAIITIGHDAKNIPSDADLVVYTIAIPETNPELVETKSRGIDLMTYPQTLTSISTTHRTIAISGTHGKTSTTGMVASILMKGDMDPTVIIGSLIKTEDGERSNFIAGASDLFVVEACEYKRSFLNIVPDVAVILNIEEDHLDYYKGIQDIVSAFKEFVLKIKPNGTLILDLSDLNIKDVAEYAKVERPDVSIVDFSTDYGQKFDLSVPGIHNQKNAAAAYRAALAVGVSDEQARHGLNVFAGTWRRLEYKGKTAQGAVVYDDYAHHPSEVKASIEALRELYPTERLIVAFQPHLFSRTKQLLEEFAVCFKGVDELLLAPIFAARELNDSTISSGILAERIIQTGTVPTVMSATFEEIETLFSKESSGSVCVTMGAGNIYTISGSISS
ncbi:MAG: murC [Parcubacteria group bacterium]|nr:murC [Parcubacteria group bacterium]